MTPIVITWIALGIMGLNILMFLTLLIIGSKGDKAASINFFNGVVTTLMLLLWLSILKSL